MLQKKFPCEYLEVDLPQKKHQKTTSNIRHLVLTVYHRLFGIVFISNMAVLIALCIHGADSQILGLVTVANIFIVILIRQDYVVNALFTIFTSVCHLREYFLYAPN